MNKQAKSISVVAPRFDVAKAARLLNALGNPIRFKVVSVLIEGDCDVGTLADAVGLGQSATSQHLRILRDCQIVGTTRYAQRIMYSLQDPGAARLVETVRQVLDAPADRSGSRPG